MPNEPRLQILDLVTTVPEYQYPTAQEFTNRTATVTTMNASAGTVISAQFGATSACVGCFLIPEDGAIRAQARQIVKYVVSTTTATLDAGWVSSTGVTTMRVWMPAEVPARATATGTTTSLTSSPHGSVTNEADDTWNNAFLLGRTTGTANAGGMYKVVDFTSAGGVFDVTGDPFTGAPADGDLFLLRYLARPEGPITATVNRKVVDRQITGFRAADQAVPVTAEGSVEFMAALRPLTASAGASAATPPFEMGQYLRDFMTQTLDTGSTVSSASAGSLTPAAGTFTIGGFVLCANGEAAQIEDSAGGVLTVPQLVTVPATSSTIYAAAHYKMKSSSFFTRAWDIFRGRLQRQYFGGCGPAVELQISRDQVIKFSMKYTAGDVIQYTTGDPNSLTGHLARLLDLTVPVDGKGARVMLNGTRVLVGDIKITFGLKPTLRPCLSGINQYSGVFFDFDATKVVMTGYLADNDDTSGATDIYDQMETGQPVRFFYQKGSNPKETFCLSIPALGLTKATYGVENNEGAFSIEGSAVLPGAVRGGSFSSSLPDFAIGWC